MKIQSAKSCTKEGSLGQMCSGGCERIGVLGGTFDPIHYGHLFAAEEARVAFCLDRVVFVPTGKPPHKDRADMASAAERYEMALLATADNPFFAVTRLETDRTGNSYTVDTLKEMRAEYPSADFFLIVGSDTVGDIINWKAPCEIPLLCSIVVVERAGFSDSSINTLPEAIQRAVQVFETSPLEISATDIRNRIRSGKSVKYFLPPAVSSYIFKNNLYLNSGGELF